MFYLVIGMNDGILAVFFLAVFQRFGVGVGRRKCYTLGIRRPIESIHVVLGFRELLRLSAARRNHVQLLLAFGRILDLPGPVGKERNPFSVRGPRRIGAGF